MANEDVLTIENGVVEECDENAVDVVIPEGVKKIGNSAFRGCKSLLSVEFGGSIAQWEAVKGKQWLLKYVSAKTVKCSDGEWQKPSLLLVENGVLAKCLDESAPSITIPESVTEIGNKAFFGCKSLSSVVIPEGVTEIGEGAFYGCKSLSSVEFGGTRAQWEAVKGKQWLLKYVSAKTVKCSDGEWQKPSLLLVENGVLAKCFDKSAPSITIPESVTEIGNGAFLTCKSLTSVVIGESVTKIGDSAFWDCESLSSVVIPASVKEIGDSAFWGCESLSSVVIPASVTEIGDWAFNDCESLSSVEFGGTMAQWEAVKGKHNLLEYVPAKTVKCSDDEWQKPAVLVENGVLMKCFDNSATSVTIPEGVTEIGYEAFAYCDSLTSVVIGEGVTKIGNNAFLECTSLKSVVIGEGVTEIGEHAFRNCESLTSVVIPEGVKEIGEEAFCWCKSLESVVIPEGVTEIGDGAFEGCESLTSLEFGGTRAQWEAIDRGYDWQIGVLAETVKCTDGEVSL